MLAFLVEDFFPTRNFPHALVSVVLIQGVEHLTIWIIRRSLSKEAIVLHFSDPLLTISECEGDKAMGEATYPGASVS